MSEQQIVQHLQTVFREIFDKADLTISLDTTAADLPDWDSLAHVNLLMAVESEFGISFSLEELQTAKNVSALVKLVMSKLA